MSSATEGETKSGFFNFLKEIASIVVMSLVIVLPIRYYLIQPFVVKGSSMEPNFSDGEYLIINEIGYRFNEPQRGDVIVFKYPNDPSEFYIKRIVGLPGEKVAVSDGEVKISRADNEEIMVLNESDYLPEGVVTSRNVEIALKEDEYFVLGDNRGASSDSRTWGVLPKDLIIGRTWVKVYPFNDFKIYSD